MRIAIDATSVPAQPAGAGVYAIELVRAMTERDRHDGYAVFARGGWLEEAARGKPNWRIEHVAARSRTARLAWEQLSLPARLSALRIDVLHSTHHTLPLRPTACARVVTLHDLTFFRIPERYPVARRLYMQTLTRLSARVADAIIVPSETVRAEVMRVLGVLASKVSTVYEAAAADFTPGDRSQAAAVARGYGIDGPYVLSVGSLEPGKNRGRLIEAMRRLRNAGHNERLVIVGQRGWKYAADLELIDRLGMGDRVVMPGYVKREHLPALYRAATVFAFPSLYEGFGLPVLEAMACGTPVLTSNVSATAEVAKNAALIVAPLSVDAITDGLRRLLCHEELRGELARRGIERAAEFSWRKAADETHDVYRRAVQARTASR